MKPMYLYLAVLLGLCCAPMYGIDLTPTWYVDARCFFKSGVSGAFDEVSVKDPSIVYAEGKYHMFFTGVTKQGWWQMGYASASTIADLSTAQHTFLSALSEGYFCAPQVFYFEPHAKWYIIYNSGSYGAAYSTTTKIGDPASWTARQSLGIPSPTGYDFWIICDDNYAYIFMTTGNGSERTIGWRRTNLSGFPTGWGALNIAATDTFEGVCVYKNQADGKYYMLAEDYYDNRYYELWSASNLSGPWTKLTEQWATYHRMVYNADHWTDSASHGEIIRSGVNQKMEITDMDKVDFLIQGVKAGSYPDYAMVPWDLGIIRNYNSQTTQKRGDVNGSGTVDIVDALLIARYSAGLNPAGFVTENADVNTDGQITILDALLTARYSAGLIPNL
jgi:hypothetical protein